MSEGAGIYMYKNVYNNVQMYNINKIAKDMKIIYSQNMDTKSPKLYLSDRLTLGLYRQNMGDFK